MAQPFEGIRVLDLTHVLAGPFCTYQLAVLGADVIKIEPPHAPDCARFRGPDAARNAARRGLTYEVQGGNKRALALDLKTDAAATCCCASPTRADVLVENYRAGALAALGLDDAAFERANPRAGPLLDHRIRPGRTARRRQRLRQRRAGRVGRDGAHGHGRQRSREDGRLVRRLRHRLERRLRHCRRAVRARRDGRGQRIDCAMYRHRAHDDGPGTGRDVARRSIASRRSGPRLLCHRRRPAHARRVHAGAESPPVERARPAGLRRAGLVGSAVGACRRDARRTRRTDARTRPRTAGWPCFANSAFRRSACAASTKRRATRSWPRAHCSAALTSESPTVPVAAFSFAHDGPRLTRRAPGVGEHSDEILHEVGLSASEIAQLRAAGAVA